MKKRRGKRKPASRARKWSLRLGLLIVVAFAGFATISDWYVHHPKEWLAQQRSSLPKALTAPLYSLGNVVGDFTDALDLTGHDTVYEYDTEAPVGQVLFAGAPVRISGPMPDDIRVIPRGEFILGWSDKLRHPAWCAYHVKKEARFPADKRPSFTIDRSIPLAPNPKEYTKSGYDRGHMAPNYAITSRYGEIEQKKTFMMSNIAPQLPALNRGVWRDIEHRIAEFWTARYGEIWVVVGCIPGKGKTISQPGIDIPEEYFQVIIAQEGMNIRALAILLRQNSGWDECAARNIVTIDELEALTGLNFNPELPDFIQEPLEAELPTRLWPIRLQDIPKFASLAFTR